MQRYGGKGLDTVGPGNSLVFGQRIDTAGNKITDNALQGIADAIRESAGDIKALANGSKIESAPKPSIITQSSLVGANKKRKNRKSVKIFPHEVPAQSKAQTKRKVTRKDTREGPTLAPQAQEDEKNISANANEESGIVCESTSTSILNIPSQKSQLEADVTQDFQLHIQKRHPSDKMMSVWTVCPVIVAEAQEFENSNNSASKNSGMAKPANIKIIQGNSSTEVPDNGTKTLTVAGASMLNDSLRHMCSGMDGIRRRHRGKGSKLDSLLFDSQNQTKQSNGVNDNITHKLSSMIEIERSNCPSVAELDELMLHQNMDQLVGEITQGSEKMNQAKQVKVDVDYAEQVRNSVSLHQLSSILQRNNSAMPETPQSQDKQLIKQLLLQFKKDAVKRQKRAVLMLLCIFMIICLCWCPIAINFMIDKPNQFPSILYVLFTILAWTNSCVNIIVYACMNPRFLNAYKALLSCSRAKEDEVTEVTPATQNQSGLLSTAMDIEVTPATQNQSGLLSTAMDENTTYRV